MSELLGCRTNGLAELLERGVASEEDSPGPLKKAINDYPVLVVNANNQKPTGRTDVGIRRIMILNNSLGSVNDQPNPEHFAEEIGFSVFSEC
ncbi:hypothetical protein KEHDKFFH_17620 [Marinobacter maroccanus]|uniref:Uncharacterized protein n=1 Tax=Marinobacter maroccanus TaxID=2055143 RepID=A0A2S5Z6H0_9GAMM|nr:hypothetical protein KEHDKFFH_17620 [Marinobacter maroccanus]